MGSIDVFGFCTVVLTEELGCSHLRILVQEVYYKDVVGQGHLRV